MKRLEAIVSAYWLVGHALKHPDAPPISTSKALKALNQSDKLRPTESRLDASMHTLRYDIIEGNTEWRGKQKVQNSKLIQLTRK